MATSIDELLDRAIAALNDGEVDRAHSLAGEVLAADGGNVEATHLLATAARPAGEIRRLTVMFCDLVGSTELSERVDPESYRTIVARFQRACRGVIEQRYDGFIVNLKGDGILASFGFPVAHENDADRAVRAGLDLLTDVKELTDEVARTVGEQLGVRIAVHKGLVYLDLDERDLYGFAVNVAARLEALADTDTLLISEEIRRLIGDRFELRAHEPRSVKGVSVPLVSYTVLGESVGSGVRASGPIIGRTGELDLLAELWDVTRGGAKTRGACATIVGDAGIGKSRLAAAVAELAEKPGATVVELFGSPLETSSGLWPVRRLIAGRCGFTREMGSAERLQRLRAVVADLGVPVALEPALATLLGIPHEAGYEQVESDARRLRDEIEDAAFAFLQACFAAGPGLFVCEDAHWFDAQTHDFVKRAVQQLAAEVLTVVTSRDPQLVPRGTLVTAVALAPLEREEALDLAMALQSDGRTRDELMDVVDRSDGVPLFLEELMRIPATASPAAPVPDVLYEPLIARLNLSAAGATVAAAVAAIEAEADPAMLAVVAEIRDAELDAALRALVDAHILVRSDDAVGRYRFRHELLRQVVYDLQPPTRRQALHARVAGALVADAVDEDAVDWQRVADHLVAAAQAGPAADAYERASELARRRGALIEARLLLSHAIDALADGPQATFARQARLRLGRAYLSLSLEGNQSADAAEDYQHCLEMLVGQPVGDEMIATLFALWSYYAARAEFDKADDLLEGMRATNVPLPPVFDAVIDGSCALVAFYRGEHRRSRELWSRQREQLATVAEADFTRQWFIPLDPIVIARTSEMWSHIVLGDFASALPLMDLARTMSAALPFPRGPFTLAGFLGFESWFHFEVGDYEGAMRVVDEMAEISARHGFDTWAVIAATQREVYTGIEKVRAGQGVVDDQAAFSALAATVGGYMTMWKMIEQYLWMPYYLTAQALFHYVAGETDLAVAALEDARAIAARTGMYFYEPETIRFLARLRPSLEEQAAGFREAMELAGQQGALMYELHAALDLAGVTGDLSEVVRLLDEFPEPVSFPALIEARQLVKDSSASR